MSKKQLFSLAFAAFSSVSMMAGGLLTNTNQNAAFLRQLSQEAVIDITGAYMNPAGIAFLNKGFHLSLNVQSAKQTREITTSFPLFAANMSNPNATHEFVGEAVAPVVPSFQVAYVADKWSVAANFAVGGGGGKCEFDKGLGSFETLFSSTIAQTLNTTLAGVNSQYGTSLAFGGYDMKAYMKGRQYYFGLSIGGTYKITNNLSAYLGLRGVYADCNYNGWINDVKARVIAGTNPMDAAVLKTVQDKVDGTLAQTSVSLNANQNGFGITPIIGVDWKINDQWNVAAKYEFKTRMRLENDSEMNDYTKALAASNEVIGQFADGKKIAADVPSLFTIGAQYSPISSVRINAGFHFFDDCNATQYGDKQKNIDAGTTEITAGAEYDVCKLITVSAGWQNTHYNLSDAYMNDLSFTTPSNSVGVGLRIHATKRCNIDLAYMHTFYSTHDVTTPTPVGNKVDSYTRTNRAFGVGVNLAF